MQAGLRDVLGEQGVAAMARHNFERSLPTAEEAMATPAVTAERRRGGGAGRVRGRRRYTAQLAQAVGQEARGRAAGVRGDTGGLLRREREGGGGDAVGAVQAGVWEVVEIPFDWAAERTNSGEAVARGRAAFEVRWVEDPALQGADMDVPRRC
ncbi:hypothetical protein RB595_003876 [Gaeumannomyces hyphopodioides]